MVGDRRRLREWLLRPEREVDLAVEKALDGHVQCHGVYPHRDARVRIVKPPHIVRQHGHGGRNARREVHPASAGEVEVALEIAEQAVGPAHQGIRERVEPFARGRRRGARGVIIEQRGLELALERAHVQRRCGLGDAQVLGRAGDGPAPHGLAECPKLFQPVALVAHARALVHGPHRVSSAPGASEASIVTKRRTACVISPSLRTAIP